MTYTISELETIQVVEVNSLLTEIDNKALLSDIQTRIDKGYNKIIVDLSELKFMNSVGLNLLIMLMSRLQQAGGKLAIANASDQVINLLEITKLKSQFTLMSTMDEAREAIA